jgi:hypothetical protein
MAPPGPNQRIGPKETAPDSVGRRGDFPIPLPACCRVYGKPEMRKLRYISALQAAINYRWHLMGDKSCFVPFSRAHKIARIRNRT